MTTEIFTEKHIPRAAEISRDSFPDPWSADGFSSYTETAQALCFAAVEGKDTAGYVMASTDGDSAWIDSIAVDAAYRRKGAGTLLIDALREKTGNIPVTLEVRESNLSAIGFYSKYGFEKAGIRRDMYSSPRENAVVMILKGSDPSC